MPKACTLRDSRRRLARNREERTVLGRWGRPCQLTSMRWTPEDGRRRRRRGRGQTALSRAVSTHSRRAVFHLWGGRSSEGTSEQACGKQARPVGPEPRWECMCTYWGVAPNHVPSPTKGGMGINRVATGRKGVGKLSTGSHAHRQCFRRLGISTRPHKQAAAFPAERNREPLQWEHRQRHDGWRCAPPPPSPSPPATSCQVATAYMDRHLPWLILLPAPACPRQQRRHWVPSSSWRPGRGEGIPIGGDATTSCTSGAVMHASGN